MSGESLAKFAGLVPQVYYDLIARVVPGAVACLLYGYAFAAKLRMFSSYDTVTGILFGFVLAYVIGIVLDLLSEGLFGAVFSSDGLFRRRFHSVMSDEEVWKRLDDKEEGVGHPQWSEAEKSVLIKMMAERSLMRVLLLLFLPFAIDWNGSVFHLLSEPASSSIMNYLALTAVIMLTISSYLLYWCLHRRIHRACGVRATSTSPHR